MASKWERISIVRDNGEPVDDAIAPIIISASRSTDIPAFYMEWLIKRLEAEYVVWVNPFNGKRQYVSFKQSRFFVFWSKNPKPMLSYLTTLESMDFFYYLQFTLNYYDDLQIEPKVPHVDDRIETFIRLSDRLGKERIIWRFDPLIAFDGTSISDLINRIKYVGDKVHRFTDKLVFSFADINAYGKVKRNLKSIGSGFREFTAKETDILAKSISDLANMWGIKACTCGESVNLEKYNIGHNKCIDDELILSISNHDSKICDFLGYQQGNLFPSLVNQPAKNIKDPGQRTECGCIVSKDIGRYNTCPHLCVYCYANASQRTAQKNYDSHDPASETIV